MMDLPELIILDVGHGNCTLVRETDGVILIDCPPGSTLLETLEHLSIREISHVLISHADADHIGGIINLLSNEEIKIHNVHLNPNAIKKTEIWLDLRCALAEARKCRNTQVSTELTTRKTGTLNIGSVNIEVLAPTPELILGGAGDIDIKKRKLTSNSVSAVIGIVHDTHRIAVLAGDIDKVGLENLAEDIDSCNADILVFPHHGGRPGDGDAKEFTQKICSFIQPKLIIFSIDRHRFNNPRSDIVEEIINSFPEAHILCTQLSKQCAANVPIEEPAHLSGIPARGSNSNSCCGGSINIKINGDKKDYISEFFAHKEFVTNQVPNAICRKFIPR